MAALPPGPAVLGLVSAHAQIVVAGEDTLAVVDPVAAAYPTRVAGVLPHGAFIYALDDGGLAAVMVRAPSPEPEDHYTARARRDDCIKTAFILSFTAILAFFMILQFLSTGHGVMATAAPEICYPWEAPPPSPAWILGDGSWNGDNRAHAAEGGRNGTHRAHAAAGEGWSSNERIKCFTLLVRKATNMCLRMGPEDAARTTAAAAPACYHGGCSKINGDDRCSRSSDDNCGAGAELWSHNEDRANCFNLVVEEAKETCFRWDDSTDTPYDGLTPT